MLLVAVAVAGGWDIGWYKGQDEGQDRPGRGSGQDAIQNTGRDR
jgi:hypothetical protein